VTFADEPSVAGIYVVYTNDESKVEELTSDNNVSVEVDKPVKLLAQTTDWGVTRIGADKTWSESTGSGVIVAVIDTGVQLDHPDLVGQITTGYDFINFDDQANDENGHGTHVSGIIAAANNGSGTVGASYSVQIMPLKVLNADGWGYLSDVAKAIYYAADHSARVVNMSLGSSSDSSVVKDAVRYAYNKGVLLVAAAGNDSGAPCNYPAAYEDVICVVATDQDNKIASFSNIGGELAAPGVSNYSTYLGSQYAY
jgi:subtilisin family serine protease